MKQFILDLFNEKSTVSSIRVMSIMCVIAAIVIAVMGLEKASPDYSGLSLLVSTFLGAAFVGKVSQKSIEAKGVKIEEKSNS